MPTSTAAAGAASARTALAAIHNCSGVYVDLSYSSARRRMEGGKYALALIVLENVQRLFRGLLAYVVAVLALHEVVVKLVLEPFEVAVPDVLDVDPLNCESAP